VNHARDFNERRRLEIKDQIVIGKRPKKAARPLSYTSKGCRMSRTQQQGANQRTLPVRSGLLKQLPELSTDGIEADAKFLGCLAQTAVFQ
jgi:hypothetical protein